MSDHLFPDGNGDKMRLFEDDGRILHGEAPHWNAVTQMASREDDVMICTYPKSGTHWMWEIVRMLKTGETELTRQDMKHHLLLFNSPASLDAMASPRVLTSHRQFHDLPTDFIINRRKLVLVLRDPRDVCVSFHDFMSRGSVEPVYRGTFGGFITLFLTGKVPMNSWSRWVLSYEKGLKEHPEIPYHVVHYEKLLENPIKEIGRLAEFLEVDATVADTVAEKTKFSAMQDFKSKTDIPEIAELFSDKRVNAHVFRKGKTGGWKESFNEEQLTHFTKTLCNQLGRSSIQPLLHH